MPNTTKILQTLVAIIVIALAIGISYYWVQRDKDTHQEQVAR